MTQEELHYIILRFDSIIELCKETIFLTDYRHQPERTFDRLVAILELVQIDLEQIKEATKQRY